MARYLVRYSLMKNINNPRQTGEAFLRIKSRTAHWRTLFIDKGKSACIRCKRVIILFNVEENGKYLVL